MNRRDTPSDPTVQAARALFDRASDRLDLATANRLRLIRRDALATSSHPRRWLPATTALAAVALVAVIWWRPIAGPDKTAVTAVPIPASAADIGVVSDDDADLYAWLGDAPVAPDDEAGSL